MSFELARAPDVLTLMEKFRPWHVESLLSQAAALIEQCLRQYVELRSLERAKREFELQIAHEKAHNDVEKSREGYASKRQIDEAKLVTNFINNSAGSFQSSVAHANQLYGYWGALQAGGAGHIMAGQSVNEKSIQAEARLLESEIASKKSEWAGLDETHATDRHKTIENCISNREDEAKPGKPLNFQNSIAILEERAKNTYILAIERAVVAAHGLRLIFDYQSAVPDYIQDNPEKLLSDWANWLLNATSFLAAHSMRDQGFVRIFSLKRLVDWEQLRGKPVGSSQEFKFDLSSAAFANHWNVRLRGISASYLGAKGDYPWALEIKVPEYAKFERETAEADVDQKMPPVYIGRAENRDSCRPHDLCGGVTILNASPIAAGGARWQIMIQPTNIDIQKLESLEDIVLEIVCVGQPRGRA